MLKWDKLRPGGERRCLANKLEVLKRIVPEMIVLLEKRYNILRAIKNNQPIGRRLLSERLALGERIVRKEVEVLKKQQLLVSNSNGVSLTPDGKRLMPQLAELVHDFRGLFLLETYLQEKLDLEKVCIVPGDIDNDNSYLRELGKLAGKFVGDIVQDDWVVSVTGGTTMAEVARQIPLVNDKSRVLVVPARGGLGESVEIQANTIAAEIAKRLGGSYKLLYVPDDVSEEALENLLLDHRIQATIKLAKKANLLVHGIGVPEIMAARRDLKWSSLVKSSQKLPVGEAFGYYFAADGSIEVTTPTVGPKLEDLARLNLVVAVAGGKSKARAILAVLRAGFVKVLFTDQGAAELIKETLEKGN